MKKYAIIDPQTGIYSFTNTITERDNLLSEIAWNFYLNHTHNQPFSIVQINEDSTETWFAPDGTPQLSPKELELLAAEWAKPFEQ